MKTLISFTAALVMVVGFQLSTQAQSLADNSKPATTTETTDPKTTKTKVKKGDGDCEALEARVKSLEKKMDNIEQAIDRLNARSVSYPSGTGFGSNRLPQEQPKKQRHYTRPQNW
jgi:peptidoglycan hydrolase CwlO-like protein